MKKVRCFDCGDFGHFATNFPSHEDSYSEEDQEHQRRSKKVFKLARKDKHGKDKIKRKDSLRYKKNLYVEEDSHTSSDSDDSYSKSEKDNILFLAYEENKDESGSKEDDWLYQNNLGTIGEFWNVSLVENLGMKKMIVVRINKTSRLKEKARETCLLSKQAFIQK